MKIKTFLLYALYSINPDKYSTLKKDKRAWQFFFMLVFISSLIMTGIFIISLSSVASGIDRGLSSFDRLELDIIAESETPVTLVNNPRILVDLHNDTMSGYFMKFTEDKVIRKIFSPSLKDLTLWKYESVDLDNYSNLAEDKGRVKTILGILIILLIPTFFVVFYMMNLLHFIIVVILAAAAIRLIFFKKMSLYRSIKICLFSSVSYIIPYSLFSKLIRFWPIYIILYLLFTIICASISIDIDLEPKAPKKQKSKNHFRPKKSSEPKKDEPDDIFSRFS